MTIPVSTVPAAKAALVALINAQSAITSPPAGTEVKVAYDDPGPNIADDFVVVGKVSRTVSELAMIGSFQAGSLQEQYTIDVVCESFRGDDPQGASERAWTLASAVETAVRTDSTLNATVWVAEPNTSEDQGVWDADNKGFTATVTVTIAVTGII